MTRLLLAKGLARKEEIGIFRALGAPRRALFVQHLLQASLLAVPAALLAQLMALPYLRLWNLTVHDTDIPLHLTARGAVMGMVPAIALGLAAGIYPAWRLSGARPTLSMVRR
jgi:putative ABC transport system permease protein